MSETFKPDPLSPPDQNYRILEYWRMLTLLTGHVHMWHAARCSRRKHWLTISNIAATVMVFLSSTSDDIKTLIDVFVPFLTVGLGQETATASASVTSFAAALVVISTMLQFYLRYEERHLEHKISALEYFNLSNKILRFMQKGVDEEAVHKLTTHMNFLNRGSPGHFRSPIQRGLLFQIWHKIRAGIGFPAGPDTIVETGRIVDQLEADLRRGTASAAPPSGDDTPTAAKHA